MSHVRSALSTLEDGRFGSKVPILLYFVEPKRPSCNCQVKCFLTDRTALVRLSEKFSQKFGILSVLVQVCLFIYLEQTNKRGNIFMTRSLHLSPKGVTRSCFRSYLILGNQQQARSQRSTHWYYTGAKIFMFVICISIPMDSRGQTK